jgi:alkanesulfonate monooxygenase SsuD/methylene tetrahydromethanopterin reductase-like flavin-dependent oxidoreductase (luciferase family)
MRHPTVQASECVGIDDLSGGRFIMGLGAGKVGTEYLDIDMKKFTPVRTHRECTEMIRGIASGKAFAYDGELFKCDMPAVDRAKRGLRTEIPVYIGATGPLMQKLAGEISDGLLLPGLTSPGFTRYARKNCQAGAAATNRTLAADFPVGGVILAACSKDGKKAKDATRSYTGTYIINKLRNIKNDVILSTSGLPDSTWAPFRKAIADGTEDRVTHLVTDAMQRAFTCISGTPEECLEITQELVDAGLNLPLLEVVGASEADNLETIRLYGEVRRRAGAPPCRPAARQLHAAPTRTSAGELAAASAAAQLQRSVAEARALHCSTPCQTCRRIYRSTLQREHHDRGHRNALWRQRTHALPGLPGVPAGRADAAPEIGPA